MTIFLKKCLSNYNFPNYKFPKFWDNDYAILFLHSGRVLRNIKKI